MPAKPIKPKARLQLVLHPKLDKMVRDIAHKQREWPSTTGGRLLATALGLDPSEFGYDAPQSQS